MPLVAAARRRALRGALLAWWDAGHRALPWRFPAGQGDPYRTWISEVMLQQTQVAAVVPYYLRFVARLPTLEALAAAPEEEVLALWSGLGYYARGRRLREAARAMLARHGGVPRSAEALRALPGFGPYTAGAVASIAFGLEEPCVDGNVARVLARLFLVEGAPERPAARARLWALAGALVRGPRPGELNQALMELGATVCGKPAPRCAECPVARACRARQAGRAREVPPARARPAARRLEVACALVARGGRLLLERRPPGGLFGGLWQLPAAEVAPGEDARAALARALAARGLRLAVGAEVARVERVLTHRRLGLTAFRGRAAGALPARDDLRLAAPDELARLPLATATRALLAAAEGGGRAGGRGAASGGRPRPGRRGAGRVARPREKKCADPA